MQKKILLQLICFSGFILKSQITYVKGYLIPLKGDTIKGEIKINPKKEHENYSKVVFKDAEGVQKNYRPERVKAYGFSDQHYVSIKHDDETKFYKRLANGYILFYKVAFEITGVNETTFDYDYFLFKDGDKKLTNIKQNKFKKQIQEWMSGQPVLADEFHDEKNFNEKRAAEVINKYNEWKKNN
jgi:hypothetical protein